MQLKPLLIVIIYLSTFGNCLSQDTKCLKAYHNYFIEQIDTISHLNSMLAKEKFNAEYREISESLFSFSSYVSIYLSHLSDLLEIYLDVPEASELAKEKLDKFCSSDKYEHLEGISAGYSLMLWGLGDTDCKPCQKMGKIMDSLSGKTDFFLHCLRDD